MVRTHHEVYVAIIMHEVLHELLKAVLLSTHLCHITLLIYLTIVNPFICDISMCDIAF